MVRGGRGQRRAAQSAQLQLWAPPMVLSLFLVVGVLLLTTSGVESRSICDGSARLKVSADGRCRCRIARRPQHHMRAVAVAPPGGLLLTWHEPSSLHLPCGQSWGGHVATSSQRFGGSSSFLHLDCAHTWRTCHRERDARGQVSKEEIDPYYLYLN